MAERADELLKLANQCVAKSDFAKAVQHLTEATKLRPNLKELWSNRAFAWSALGRHEDALADARQCMLLAPTFSKGYLRAGRCLMSMERNAEAEAMLRVGRQLAPRNSTMIDAHKEAKFLAACQERDQLAMRRSQKSGVGEEDIIGILRGRCKKAGCPCNAYVQKHGRTTVMLQGRGMVENAYDTRFFTASAAATTPSTTWTCAMTVAPA